jgi:two-component system OmpR family sensor kinase
MASLRVLDDVRLTPFRIALIYVLLGGAWILFTDQLLAALPLDSATVTRLQTGKGWVFVVVSGLLVYALVARSRRELQSTNERLARTLKQLSVIHRVLRHNLRNLGTVVELNASSLGELSEDSVVEEEEAIHRCVERLTEMGFKARLLRDLMMGPETERQRLDVAAVVQEEVAAIEERYPELAVETDLPAVLEVRAHGQFRVALAELLENAAYHGEGGTVRVEGSRLGERVHLDVADDGPGMPEMERDVLESGTERPLKHSQGLGLWLVRVVVTESGGSIQVVDNEPTGTVVRLTLEAAAGDR